MVKGLDACLTGNRFGLKLHFSSRFDFNQALSHFAVEHSSGLEQAKRLKKKKSF